MQQMQPNATFFRIALLLCLTLPACVASTSPSTRPATRPTALPGVSNFAIVSDSLWRGAQPTAEGFAELKARGVKTIVNLRSTHSDRDKLKGLGLRYVHLNCKAWHPEDEDFIAFLKIVQDPANHPVFVHCQHGADRTGCAVAVYRIIEQGWTADEAIAELPAFGYHTIFPQIKTYLKDLNPASFRQTLEQAGMPEVDVVR